MQRDLTNIIQHRIEFADYSLDPTYQTIITPDKIIRLRNKLFFVLAYLVSNQGKLVTREQLVEDCWLGNHYTGQKAVTHSIYHLRKLIEELRIPASITTLSKQGYIFRILDHTSSKRYTTIQDYPNQEFSL